jgi:hypothetical protein
LGDAAGWAIADAQKDEFWRMAENERPLMEIRILGNDHEAVPLGKQPDEAVVSVDNTISLS